MRGALIGFLVGSFIALDAMRWVERLAYWVVIALLGLALAGAFAPRPGINTGAVDVQWNMNQPERSQWQA